MPSLVFNQTKTGLFQRTLDLTTGTFYVHLLTVEPTVPTITTVAQTTLAAGGNYALKAVSGNSFSTSGNTVLWRFNNPVWSGLTTDNTATIKGMLVCKQAGAAPATTDPIICYNALTNAYTPNGANFTVQVPAAGVLTGS